MKKIGILFPLLFLGCASVKVAKEQKIERDSVRVEIRTEYIERIDTAYIELPFLSQSILTKDTTSILENTFARSEASIVQGGMLFHSLETKTTKVKVQVVVKEKMRDSVIYKNRDVYVEKPIIVEKPLSKFVKYQIVGFWILLVGFLLYVYVKIKTFFF